ncbi:hypothetical protein SAMN05421541_104356 [Actinoplanes philippinensis]|uniref:YokE-like PH domain-containing protein n=2 Tax=Actinoplanes philippinensis TaxID=35752 RepID=A0A1I2ECY9_9ACTN|nr:hypothetical protein SAMN05421541_104356 [Actinoplanes philippinensis]
MFRSRVAAAVAGHLLPGEQFRVGARAVVGNLTASRLGTALSRGIIPGVADAATDWALKTTGKQVVAVTDRRMLFFSQTFWGGPGDELLMIVPRELVSLAEAKFGVVSVVRVAFAVGGVSLTFPLVDRGSAKALAAELGRALPRHGEPLSDG